MNLKTGAIDNTERKFIFDPSKSNGKSLHNSFYTEFLHGGYSNKLILEQFYLGDQKYRKIVDCAKLEEFENGSCNRDMDEWGDSFTGYTRSTKTGNVTHVQRIKQSAYLAALAEASYIITEKSRETYNLVQNSVEYQVDVDYYEKPSIILIEVSGKDLEKFVPPSYLKEVTGDPMFSAKEMYKSFRETVRRQMEEMP